MLFLWLYLTERDNVKNVHQVRTMRCQLEDALRFIFKRIHSGDANFFETMARKMLELGQVSQKWKEKISWFRNKTIKLTPLFCEIFEFPKT